ncbi:MAG: SDH family Clp fold serine proteinase [Planctomycetota bacterium]|jgi:membrane-bound ClpP family serine protease
MPNWNDVLKEINEHSKSLDVVRRKYLKRLHQHTGRNIIAYYSGWLQKPGFKGILLNDADKNGFMTTIHNLDKKKGLDLILHTPGGNMGATESIVDYLHSMFKRDIRAIVPQIAMSAGTMIACACKEIIMGSQSNLGPIDPQFNGIATSGVLEEFKQAKKEIKDDPSTIPLWQTIIGRYHPTFIGECDKAMQWAKDVVTQWLNEYMFSGKKNTATKVKKIVKNLSDHSHHKSHDRHINVESCEKMGLNIMRLEEMEEKTQDLILTVHHAYMHTLSSSNAIKIIENHKGIAMVKALAPDQKIRIK